MSAKISSEDVGRMFREDLIFIKPTIADREELLRLMGAQVEAKGMVLPSFTEAVLKRERCYPTGLRTEFINVAVPHTDACHVVTQAIVVAKVDPPVEFAAMGMSDDIIPVNYVFMLLLKKDNTQVPLLQKLMNLCADEVATSALKAADTVEEVLRVLHGYYGQDTLS